MIEIVLAEHRADPEPVIVQARLPCRIGMVAAEATLELRLVDERPDLEVSARGMDHAPPQDFFFALRGEQFTRWRDLPRLLAQPGNISREFEAHSSSSGLAFTITVYLTPYLLRVRLFIDAGRFLEIEGNDFRDWAEDLDWILELGASIHGYVEETRRAARPGLLDHIEALGPSRPRP